MYVERLVGILREVRRVLRDDGTLWLNLGDSYNANQGAGFDTHSDGGARKAAAASPSIRWGRAKDLVGIPWRVAFALQADGWYLRSDIIWSKPNPMPESVTDRPTKAHEYLLLLAKQARYYYDADAIREAHARLWDESNIGPQNGWATGEKAGKVLGRATDPNGGLVDAMPNPAGRNARSVWEIATQPFPEAHFATYPEELVRRCVLAGTSERGECAECGAAWQRVVKKDASEPTARSYAGRGHMDRHRGGGDRPGGFYPTAPETTGWEPSCTCASADPFDDELCRANDGSGCGRPGCCEGTIARPQLVLDPFVGSGTTALVARKHGRRCIGIDLSSAYLDIAARRTQQLSLLGGVA